MARKKGNFDEWVEPQDEAAAEAEVTDEGYDEEPEELKPALRVKIKEQAAPPEPELSPTTQAEQEAGKAALEAAEASKKAALEANEKAA